MYGATSEVLPSLLTNWQGLIFIRGEINPWFLIKNRQGGSKRKLRTVNVILDGKHLWLEIFQTGENIK